MSDIAAWLLEQYDQDQRDAERARESALMEWPPDEDEEDESGGVDTYMVGLDAKRRIVELHSSAGKLCTGDADLPEAWHDYCATCGSGEPYEYPTYWPCATLKLLALPYSDRPGYREEWRPESSPLDTTV